MQYGKTIFTMSASYAQQQSGPSHYVSPFPDQHWMTQVPDPAGLSQAVILDRLRQTGEQGNDGLPEHDFVDIRYVDAEDVERISQGRFDRMVGSGPVRNCPIPRCSTCAP